MRGPTSGDRPIMQASSPADSNSGIFRFGDFVLRLKLAGILSSLSSVIATYFVIFLILIRGHEHGHSRMQPRRGSGNASQRKPALPIASTSRGTDGVADYGPTKYIVYTKVLRIVLSRLDSLE